MSGEVLAQQLVQGHRVAEHIGEQRVAQLQLAAHQARHLVRARIQHTKRDRKSVV